MIFDQILTKFDQLLTKFYQILTIYVKNHQIHVGNVQECNFPKMKTIQRQKSSRIRMLKKMLTLLDFGPENQNLVMSISTISIYQNLPISIFHFFWGENN